ncbi:hypothetical protein BDV95DRAFT_603003 [Massariosphaeria phaeospora]|uniref:Uncharacterized protein n=1 Tax=Massariosphaeria phaeospora TaxID=100035 RepID=A0A7C8IL93_9PLEO|nr:hypothetical protein BDV95DRAFT_603003 [Massariosphaeria phaeospora]
MHREWDFNKDYKSGTCSFHLEQIERCPHDRIGDTHTGMWGLLEVKDAAGKTLEIKGAHNKAIEPTDEIDLWELDVPEDVEMFKSVLPVELHIDPHSGWSLEFSYGDQNWNDADIDDSQSTYCKPEKWEPSLVKDWSNKFCADKKEGDEIGLSPLFALYVAVVYTNVPLQRRSMDCFFKFD